MRFARWAPPQRNWLPDRTIVPLGRLRALFDLPPRTGRWQPGAHSPLYRTRGGPGIAGRVLLPRRKVRGHRRGLWRLHCQAVQPRRHPPTRKLPPSASSHSKPLWHPTTGTMSCCGIPQKTYNLKTAAEAVELFPPLLDTWFQAARVEPAKRSEIVVSTPDFFAGAAALLESQPPLETWKEWLTLRVLSSAAPYLSSAFVSTNFDFYGTTLSGTPQNRERWKRGVAVVEAALGEAVGQIYVDRHFPAGHKARMETLVSNLIEAYRESISSLGWMGEETKKEALKKLDAFRPKIGFPDKWIDYSAVEIDPTDLLGNVERAHDADVDRHLDEIGKPVDLTKWLMTPQTVNAYYHPMLNEIVFPAAILQPPFFNADADDAVNYGGIGAVIGHEIGHGFDDQGSQFDGSGALRNWWTEDDRTAFEALTAKLVAQYDALSPPYAAPDHKSTAS